MRISLWRLLSHRGSHRIPTDIKLRTEEWLFRLFYDDLGWPNQLNRWLYPEVFLWDADENGDNIIPALIAFSVNTAKEFDHGKRWDLEHKLEAYIPGYSWQAYMHFLIPDGLLWAERQTEGVKLTVPAEWKHRTAGVSEEYERTEAEYFAPNFGEDYDG